MRRMLLALALPIVLSGCLNAWHSNYKCKGFPEGVQCQSVRETYAQTNYQEALTRGGDKAEAVPAAWTAPGPDGAPVQGLGYAGPLPLRTPAQVIRIWVAPWESQNGQLHLPNYIYAEVQERQWSIGERQMRVAPAISALEAVSPPDKGQARGAAAGRQAPRQPSPSEVRQNKALFPDKIQRPPVQNQVDLQQFQQLPGRVRPGEGGAAAEQQQ